MTLVLYFFFLTGLNVDTHAAGRQPGWKISAKYAVVLLTDGHKDQVADV